MYGQKDVRRRHPVLIVLALSAILLPAGCGGASSTGADVPESASLAPANATAYVTFTADEGSSQWEQAEELLDRLGGAHEGLASSVADALDAEGMTWENDLAPALGPEVVVVVTADQRFVVLTEPEDEAKLEALFDRNMEEVASASIDGWTAFAEERSTLVAYQAALARGTLRDDEAFVEGMTLAPTGSAGARLGGRRKPDRRAPAGGRAGVLGGRPGARLDRGRAHRRGRRRARHPRRADPGGGDTHYEPELVDRVPADAVAALSFGGTQGILDRVQGSIDVDEISGQLEKLTGVSLDGLVDALSGEGVLYAREGDGMPEVTLALATPDPDETWQTLTQLARRLSEQTDTPITTAAENGVEVRRIATAEVTLSFARLDDDTLIVTTGADAIARFSGDGDKLVETEGYREAADAVELGDRTRGFAYVDIDGLIPLVDGFAGGSGVPTEADDALEALDSFILQAEGEGETTTLRGFLRVTD